MLSGFRTMELRTFSLSIFILQVKHLKIFFSSLLCVITVSCCYMSNDSLVLWVMV